MDKRKKHKFLNTKKWLQCNINKPKLDVNLPLISTKNLIFHIIIIIIIILTIIGIKIMFEKYIILNKSKEIKEKYETEVAKIRETIEMQIQKVQETETKLRNEITVQSILQELLDNKTFENIDKETKIGNIGKYEVKLNSSVEGKILIENIKQSEGVKVTYKLYPTTYTNKEKVDIVLKVEGKVKSVSKPDGLIIYPNKDIVGVDYLVNSNGTYEFIVEKEDGTKITKNVIVDTIDKLKPKDFEITAETTKTGGIVVNENIEDEEANEENVKSGIRRIEYYVKLKTGKEYTKYGTNTIKNLPSGTYNVYAIAYDKAENFRKSTNSVNVTVEECREIWTEEDLIAMKTEIESGIVKNYILMDDIELTKPWEPIGDNIYDTKNISGKFDGNYHKISNIEITKTTDFFIGLFKKIGLGGKVSNLTLEGKIEGKNKVGLLAGENHGTIENVKVSGKVSGEEILGGLVGTNSRGIIDMCYSEVNVEKTNANSFGNSFGGLAGKNEIAGIIKRSVSIGTVTAIGKVNSVGGLVGTNASNYDDSYAIIENSYSTGDVTLKSSEPYPNVGGLIGSNAGYSASIARNVYTLSKVTAISESGVIKMSAGGLSGYHYRTTNGYWTPERAGVQISYGGTKVETLEEMKKQETYIGFDFENIWIMKEYPELRCFTEE